MFPTTNVPAPAFLPMPRELPCVPPASLDSQRLLRGAREVLIRHAGEVYRLRHTRNGKLILTK